MGMKYWKTDVEEIYIEDLWRRVFQRVCHELALCNEMHFYKFQHFTNTWVTMCTTCFFFTKNNLCHLAIFIYFTMNSDCGFSEATNWDNDYRACTCYSRALVTLRHLNHIEAATTAPYLLTRFSSLLARASRRSEVKTRPVANNTKNATVANYEFCLWNIHNAVHFSVRLVYIYMYIYKGKVIPVQAVEALRVARGWGSHIFRHSAHRWWQGCQPYAPAAFYPQEDSWYSFMLEAESTPGP
jgi:hypothetical protein